jgi:heme exporter protein D
MLGEASVVALAFALTVAMLLIGLLVVSSIVRRKR